MINTSTTLKNVEKWSAYILCIVFYAVAFTDVASANSIQLNNITFSSQNTDDGYIDISFDISWNNSWRTDNLNGQGINSWDAAWVFIKYRVDGGSWQHAKLLETGHNPGSGTEAVLQVGLVNERIAFNSVDNPAVGVFLYRESNGSGTFQSEGVQLRWNYAVDGVPDQADFEIDLIAIEMVYVAPGSFFAGTGSFFDFATFLEGGSFDEPFWVTPAWDKSIGDVSGSLYDSEAQFFDTSFIGEDGTLNDNYPVGLDGFYMMKHPISQQLYADFLNTLTLTQQENRVDGSPLDAVGTYANQENRNGIRIAVSGVTETQFTSAMPAVYETDFPFLPQNFLSWPDAAAFADWAGLRPFTELEYEKAARGTATPVEAEFAWGGASFTGLTGLINTGLENERASNGSANAHIGYSGSIQGPVRSGIFATAVSTRAQAGASFYGVMELSGNLFEQVINVATSSARAFEGIHGDGTLLFNGASNMENWPGHTVRDGVSGTDGVGLRGGSWLAMMNESQVSDRSNIIFSNSERSGDIGFRGARSLPSSDIIEVPLPENAILDIDGNIYLTEMINGRRWMTNNLKTTRFRDGSPILSGLDNNAWQFTTTGAFTTYPFGGGVADNTDGLASSSQVVEAYGLLYNWYAMNDERGLCPEGYSVPTNEIWQELIDYAGSSSASALRSTRTAPDAHPRWEQPNTGATDALNFAALPGGARADIGLYQALAFSGFWWTADYLFGSETTRYVRMNHNQTQVTSDLISRNYGMSVRCVEGTFEQAATPPIILPEPPAEFYFSSVTISITTNTTGGQIYYTTDGSEPDASSTLYTEPFELTETATIRAVTVAAGLTNSTVAEAIFTVVEPDVVDADGNGYLIVSIGVGQEWLVPNLRTTTYNDGTPIATGLDNAAWAANTSGAFAIYPPELVNRIETEQQMVDAYGLLYNAGAINNSENGGICPTGFMVPREQEWNRLRMDLQDGGFGSGQNGRALKSDRTAPLAHPRWDSPNVATNNYLFSALPAGQRNANGSYGLIGQRARFWSSTEVFENFYYTEGLWHSVGNLTSENMAGNVGMSVRCVSIPEELRATPVFDPPAGEYLGFVEVSISSDVPSPFILYTLDGSLPDEDSNVCSINPNCFHYNVTGPIVLSSSATVTAIARYQIAGGGQGFTPPVVAEYVVNPNFSTVTDIDGNEYTTVQIGTQMFMTENLKVTRFRDGTLIPTGLTATEWTTTEGAAFAVYDHNQFGNDINSEQAMIDAYGLLYNWEAVNDERGLCPDGWSVPSFEDLRWGLQEFIGFINQGGKLKSTRTEPLPHPRWNSPNAGATDQFFFNALPGGTRRAVSGLYGELGFSGTWWLSTEIESNPSLAQSFQLYAQNDLEAEDAEFLYYNNTNKREGLSVRCFQDIE